MSYVRAHSTNTRTVIVTVIVNVIITVTAARVAYLPHTMLPRAPVTVPGNTGHAS